MTHDEPGFAQWRAILLTLLALLLVGCSAAQPTDAPADDAPADAADAPSELTTVRTGYLPVVIYAPLYVGIERGYFADEGLELELEALRSGNDAIVQLGAGNFDISMGGANAGLFNAVERGLEFTIVASMHSERPPLATPLVISADRTDEIQSVADLEGKTVAVHTFGTAIEYWMAAALAQGGLTFDDVELRAVVFPDVPPLLQNGSIDAAVLTEPLVTIAENNGLIAVLTDDYIDGFTASYAYVNADWLEDNRDTAQRFVRAYVRALRDVQGDYIDEEIAAIIETYTDVPAAVTLQSQPAQFDPDGTIPLADLDALQAFYMERGQLEYSEPLDTSSFVDTSLIEAALAELGPYEAEPSE